MLLAWLYLSYIIDLVGQINSNKSRVWCAFLGKFQHLWYIFGFLLNIFPQKIVLNILIESKLKKKRKDFYVEQEKQQGLIPNEADEIALNVLDASPHSDKGWIWGNKVQVWLAFCCCCWVLVLLYMASADTCLPTFNAISASLGRLCELRELEVVKHTPRA